MNPSSCLLMMMMSLPIEFFLPLFSKRIFLSAVVVVVVAVAVPSVATP